MSLKALSGDVESALEHVRVPAYVIDRHGIIRWTNAVAREIVGNMVGLQVTSVLTPEEGNAAEPGRLKPAPDAPA